LERVEKFIMDQLRFGGAGKEGGGCFEKYFWGDKGRFEVRDLRIGGVRWKKGSGVWVKLYDFKG